jgi:hypothetical protein
LPKWHVEADDGIRGERIYVQARRFSDIRPVSGASGRHGARCTVARQNAEAWIELPYSPSGKFKLE